MNCWQFFHLFPASEAPSSTALLHNSFNKAHYLTVLKQSDLTSKDLKKEKKKKFFAHTYKGFQLQEGANKWSERNLLLAPFVDTGGKKRHRTENC